MEKAAEILGLAGCELLGLPDGETENDLALRERLVAIVRRVRPEVVVCPDPTALYFGDGWVNHRDHRVCGFAVLDAVAPAAASPLYFPDAGPPHQVRAVYLTGTLEPDTAVAITDVLNVKAAALACHQSQLGALAEGMGELVHELVEQRALEAGPRPRRAPRRAVPRAAPHRLSRRDRAGRSGRSRVRAPRAATRPWPAARARR